MAPSYGLKERDSTAFSNPDGEVIASGCVVVDGPCLDCDEHCLDVPDIRSCYLYSPERGYCVFL